MKVITLSTPLLMTLVKQPAMQQQFPVFQQAARQLKVRAKPGCSRCGSHARELSIATALRDGIHRWPDDLKVKLKAILQADKVVFYTNAKKRGNRPVLVEI